jgi:hypothetical protein
MSANIRSAASSSYTKYTQRRKDTKHSTVSILLLLVSSGLFDSLCLSLPDRFNQIGQRVHSYLKAERGSILIARRAGK